MTVWKIEVGMTGRRGWRYVVETETADAAIAMVRDRAGRRAFNMRFQAMDQIELEARDAATRFFLRHGFLGHHEISH